MEYTPQRFREFFPAVHHGIFFDNAGGTQTPQPVADAISQALTSGLSQRGTNYTASRNSDLIVLDARSAMADLLGTESCGIVFGRSATALTFELSRTLASTVSAGDEIVVSRLDHDANIRPWVLLAESLGANIRWIDFDPVTADLDLGHVESAVSDRTKIIAITAGSNIFGTKPPIEQISKLARKVDAFFVVDAVAYAPHELVDFAALGADALVCSPYKFFGPHIGVLAADPATLERLHPPKLVPSPDTVPERFELGTLPYELLAGVTATVDFLASFSQAATRRERLADFYAAAGAHEVELSAKAVAGLSRIPGIRRHGTPARSTPTIFFTVDGYDPSDVARYLGEREIAVSVGDFYAHEATKHVGLGPEGGIRLSFAPYNTESDVEELLRSLRALSR